ncbi:hypothetical protein [Flavobacterium sp. NKUCC04_CG]|uniref:hypothetical protein n=1 Tax=Flavobacterium sp. NKUCC04_CG TaxID=2842121 RepID=UPI001C5B1027|nr:hypothetical protein [Flavobacterium sp. NKUCC04_CG]MBW3519528.1 hypothetical protein [Flavobacterium sp. NKUCC04_CG]
MTKMNFPLAFKDKINTPEREKSLRYLSQEKKLDAREVNLFRDAINELYNRLEAAGLEKQEALINIKPIPTGFYRYMVANEGRYTHFKDAEDAAIEVNSEDLNRGLVEIWVTDNVAKKVVLYQDIQNQVEAGIQEIVGNEDLKIIVESSAGDFLDPNFMQTTLTPTVTKYFRPYNDDVVSWQWFRESGNTDEDRDSDQIWALDKNQPILHLEPEDFTPKVFDHGVTFICQAIVNGNEIITEVSL